MRLGLHTSTAGSLAAAALEAWGVGANTFQIFSASPRMWRAGAPATSDCAELQRLRDTHDLSPLVIHDNYLINLASFDATIRAKSIAAFRGEIERALLIGADYLVFHPGAAKEHAPAGAIRAVAEGLRDAARGLTGSRLQLLIENTAGQGSALGSKLEELAEIALQAQPCVDFEIGFCLDTCHSLAAGYDVASAEGWKVFAGTVEQVLQWRRIPVLHANDSTGPLGSRLDRHENIGFGHIGEAGFRRILTDPRLETKAFILETPLEQEGDDRRNLEKLKELCQTQPTPKRRISPTKSK